MIQYNFFEYKMSIGDSINAHINKVISMENLLRILGQPIFEDMLIIKIVGNLPLSYNNIITTWTNVPANYCQLGNKAAPNEKISWRYMAGRT